MLASFLVLTEPVRAGVAPAYFEQWLNPERI